MTIQDLGQKVKDKYQQYVQYPVEELGRKVIEKYPEYKSKLDQSMQVMNDIGERYGQQEKMGYLLTGGSGNVAGKVKDFLQARNLPGQTLAQTFSNLRTSDPQYQTNVKMSMGAPISETEKQGTRDSALQFAVGTTEPLNMPGFKGVNTAISKTVNTLESAVNEMINMAKKQQPAFEKQINSFAQQNNLNFQIGPIKTADRMIEKATIEEGGNLANLMDTNRSVIFIDNFDTSHDDIVNRARQYFSGSEVRYKPGKDDPMFKKTIVNIKGSQNQPVEIQFTTKPMWDAKIKGGGDKLYHEYRSIPETAPSDLLAKKQTLWDRMKNLYTEAYEKTH